MNLNSLHFSSITVVQHMYMYMYTVQYASKISSHKRPAFRSLSMSVRHLFNASSLPVFPVHFQLPFSARPCVLCWHNIEHNRTTDQKSIQAESQIHVHVCVETFYQLHVVVIINVINNHVF